jgi:hypothetical protein
MITVLLEMNEVSRLDAAMSDKRGRRTFLEVLIKSSYEGSKGQNHTLSDGCLKWASMRCVSLRALSPKTDVDSSLVCAVVMNSPFLQYLHMNFHANNHTYLELIESRCPLIEEVRLRSTQLFVTLVEDSLVFELRQERSEETTFSVIPRMRDREWHREQCSSETEEENNQKSCQENQESRAVRRRRRRRGR